jgi:hypothetical protein
VRNAGSANFEGTAAQVQMQAKRRMSKHIAISDGIIKVY